jgi:hypothetical protein
MDPKEALNEAKTMLTKTMRLLEHLDYLDLVCDIQNCLTKFVDPALNKLHQQQ